MKENQRAIIKEYLKGFINSSHAPRFAVLIEGSWGCGKTYFCKQLLEDDEFTKKSCIYISLFGLQSIEQFQTLLFFESASKAEKFAHGAAKFFSSVLKASLRIDLDGDSSPDANISASILSPKNAIKDVAKNLDGAILFLDDLERCNIDLSVMLGEINRLVEHGNTRVILIANKEKIEKTDKLDNLYDKLIGKAFTLPSDPASALRNFIDEAEKNQERECLDKHFNEIIKLHDQSNYNNIRILRQFIWHLQLILSELDDGIFDQDNVRSELIAQAFIFFVEFKHNLSEDSRTLKLEDLYNTYEDPYSTYEEEKKTARAVVAMTPHGKEKSPKEKILKKYNKGNGIYTVITLTQWIFILKTGVIDKNWLNEEIRNSAQFYDSDNWPSWKRLWYFQRRDFSDGSHEQFEADLLDMAQGLKEGRYKNPFELLHVASVMLTMSKYKLVSDTKAEIIKRIKSYIYNHIESKLSYELIHRMLSFDFSGYDDLGYPGEDNKHFTEIKTYLLECCNRQKEKWLKHKAGGELLNTLEKDFYGFARKIIHPPTQGAPEFFKIPVLHNIKAADFVRVWLSLGIREQRALPEILNERYKDKKYLLDKEGNWCHRVLRELKRTKKSEQIRPKKAQLEILCQEFNSQVLSPIEAYRKEHKATD